MKPLNSEKYYLTSECSEKEVQSSFNTNINNLVSKIYRMKSQKCLANNENTSNNGLFSNTILSATDQYDIFQETDSKLHDSKLNETSSNVVVVPTVMDRIEKMTNSLCKELQSPQNQLPQ